MTDTPATLPAPRLPEANEEPRHCLACGAKLRLRSVKAGEPDRHVCDGCGRIHFLDPKLAACVIPERDGQVLLLQRAIEPGRGKWVMPGGFVDRGEMPADAARREAREEVGLDVDIGELLGVFGTRGKPVIVVYLSAAIRGEAQALDESLAVRWVDGREIPWADLAFPSTRQSLGALAAKRGWPGPDPEEA